MSGGRRPGAGRKPGQLNKPTIQAVKFMGPVGERAIGVLVSAMEDPSAPWSCRIHAASLVADRAFGRAPQSVSLEVTRRLNDLTLAELLQELGRCDAADFFGLSCDDPNGRASVVNRRPTVRMVPPGERLGGRASPRGGALRLSAFG
jgi:hypothetical protein